MKTGIEFISEERKRQINEKNYTSDHDDLHTDELLSAMANHYVVKKCNNPHQRIIDLAKAGALCAAEIDRIQRQIN